MKKRLTFLSATLLMSATLFAAPAANGPDGELFLDPHVKSELKNITGNFVLDTGCNAAPWSSGYC